MSRKVLCQKIGGGGGFLGLDLHLHYRAWEGINIDGSGDFVSLTDLTGNGFDASEITATGGTSPIEIVPSGIGGKQALRFDGTNQISSSPIGLIPLDDDVFIFIVFKIEAGNIGGYPGRIFSVENTRLSEGSRYGIINNGGTIFGWSTDASNLSSTVTYLGDHYGWLTVTGSGGTMQFAIDGETKLSTAIGGGLPGYNNNYLAIGGNRSRYSRMLFCEAGMAIGQSASITSGFLSDLASYMSSTYGL